MFLSRRVLIEYDASTSFHDTDYEERRKLGRLRMGSTRSQAHSSARLLLATWSNCLVLSKHIETGAVNCAVNLE